MPDHVHQFSSNDLQASAGGTATPKVTAIVATIVGTHDAAARTTRGEDVVACIASILANTYTPLEVIVVDQSPHDALATALQPLCATDRRLRYIHSDAAGKTRAQNLAIRSSAAAIFAFTDDDCLVPPDWIAQIVQTFQRRPDAGLIFGQVRPPARHDWATSYVPRFEIAREERLRSTFLPRADNVFGADMAVRRETFARVGLFDETFGPGGAVTEANEEGEFTLRVLRTRPPIGVYLTPAFAVVHEHGSRPQGAATRQLLRTYQTGKSAMLTKHALRGDVGAACQLALLACGPLVNGLANLMRTGKPRGVGMIVPYAMGVLSALRLTRDAPDKPLYESEAEQIV